MPKRADVVTVTPYPDGPFVIRGPVVVMGEGGQVVRTRNATALCRCGLSGRAPLCDGSHRQARTDRNQRRAAATGPDD